MFISHTGVVSPSGFLPFDCGNVRQEHPADIYRHHPLFVSLRDNDALGGKCGCCEYHTICGGSRARAYAATGNPQSASSQRMQADVQRNVNQEQRIENGIQNGSVTNREAAKLEHGQARVEHKEARAGRDGHVGAAEQANIQHAENHQSRRIFKQKHDAQVRGEKS